MGGGGGEGDSNFSELEFFVVFLIVLISTYKKHIHILLHRDPNYRWSIPEASDDGAIWYPRLVGFGSIPLMDYSLHKIRFPS